MLRVSQVSADHSSKTVRFNIRSFFQLYAHVAVGRRHSTQLEFTSLELLYQQQEEEKMLA
jgi:hypothetical protein